MLLKMKRIYKRKIYNKQTKGYKIDIFVSNSTFPRKFLYICTTDRSITCKQAKNRYIIANTLFCLNKIVQCRFQYL